MYPSDVTEAERQELQEMYVVEMLSIPEIRKKSGRSLAFLYDLRKEQKWEDARQAYIELDLNTALARLKQYICDVIGQLRKTGVAAVHLDEIHRWSLVLNNLLRASGAMIDQTTALACLQVIEGVNLAIPKIASLQDVDEAQKQHAIALLQRVYESEFERLESHKNLKGER